MLNNVGTPKTTAQETRPVAQQCIEMWEHILEEKCGVFTFAPFATPSSSPKTKGSVASSVANFPHLHMVHHRCLLKQQGSNALQGGSSHLPLLMFQVPQQGCHQRRARTADPLRIKILAHLAAVWWIKFSPANICLVFLYSQKTPNPPCVDHICCIKMVGSPPIVPPRPSW